VYPKRWEILRVKLKEQPQILLLAVLLVMSCTGAQAATPGADKVEVAFVHNIAKFVEWPAAGGAKGALRLCVLGQGPFGKAAENLLRDKPIGNMVWSVVPVNTRANLKECQVLFIEASEAGALQRLLGSLTGSPVLTVGDTDGYGEQGVIVNFYLEQEKVRFEINNDAAGRGGLKISSQLLKLARIVREAGGAR